MNAYMHKKNLSFELQGRVRKYLHYIFKKQNTDNKEKQILEKLSKALRKEVILEVNGKILLRTPFLTDNFSKEALQSLAFCLNQLTYSPEEYIYQVFLNF